MTAQPPWLELTQSEHGWQALFACQFYARSFEERQKLRWGFNAAALLGEALDRQKLFLETQHHGNPLQEIAPGERSLALRCIRVPDVGLLLALLGKVSAPSPELARENALEYCHELTSTFPIDYETHPAVSRSIFEKLTGKKLLEACQVPRSMAQLLRFETQTRTKNGLVVVNGFWQATDRSDELIWRILGNYPRPVMFNVSLRPSILDNDERQLLWDTGQVSLPSESISQAHPAQPFDQWAEPLVNRRLNPWKRFYLLQVHLLSPTGITDSLARPIGAALTREHADLLSPGFLTVFPATESALKEWRAHLEKLEIAPTHFNPSSLSRLSDLADLDEAQQRPALPLPARTRLAGGQIY